MRSLITHWLAWRCVALAGLGWEQASSIVLLSPEDRTDDNEADALVMARTMALLSLNVRAPVIAEIRDKDNLAAMHEMIRKHGQQLQDGGSAGVSGVGSEARELRQRVLPCAGNDIVGNVMVQGALQPGACPQQNLD